MKTHGTAATVAVGLLTMACGYTVKTSSDYDHSVNFEKYQTFSVRTGNSSGRVVDDQRIAADVAAALRAKGWREVPENEARATVVVHTSTRTTHTNETFYDGWGGWRWRPSLGFTSATTSEQDYKVGSVVVDIFDARGRVAIWHGRAKDVLTGRSADHTHIDDRRVAKMFASFPYGPPRSASDGR